MSDLKGYPKRPQSVADREKYPAGAGFEINMEEEYLNGADFEIKVEEEEGKYPVGTDLGIMGGKEKLNTGVRDRTGRHIKSYLYAGALEC